VGGGSATSSFAAADASIGTGASFEGAVASAGCCCCCSPPPPPPPAAAAAAAAGAAASSAGVASFSSAAAPASVTAAAAAAAALFPPFAAGICAIIGSSSSRFPVDLVDLLGLCAASIRWLDETGLRLGEMGAAFAPLTGTMFGCLDPPVVGASPTAVQRSTLYLSVAPSGPALTHLRSNLRTRFSMIACAPCLEDASPYVGSPRPRARSARVDIFNEAQEGGAKTNQKKTSEETKPKKTKWKICRRKEHLERTLG